MPEYFRIKVGENGKTFVVDEEGNKIPPERHRAIANQIIETVDEDAYVYVGYSPTKMLYKIGVTGNIERREKELGIDIFFMIKCEPWGDYSPFTLEKLLHRIFTKLGQHIEGEWFELDGIDLFWLANVHKNVKDGHIKEEFGAAFEIERKILHVWENPNFISPYELISRAYHPSQWKAIGVYGLYQIKALSAFYEIEIGDRFLALGIYDVVICAGYKSVFKKIFKNTDLLTENILQGDYISLVEDFQNLGILPIQNEEGGAE
jgi:hypothetical protein